LIIVFSKSKKMFWKKIEYSFFLVIRKIGEFRKKEKIVF